jgi:hypothetical protein
MIKRKKIIGYIPPHCENEWIVKQFAIGAEADGVEFFTSKDTDHPEIDCNFALVRGACEKSIKLRQQMAGRRKKTIFIDLGYFKRGADCMKGDEGYYQVGIGSINQIPMCYCPPNRWEELGLPVISKRKAGKDYLICGQVAEDKQHGMTEEELQQRYLDIYENLTDCKVRERFIKYRPHPRGCKTVNKIPIASVEAGIDLGDHLAAAAAIFTINSTLSLEALRQAIPVFSNRNSFYALMANAWDDKDSIEYPILPDADDRLVFFQRIAWAQWTGAEMAAGEAYEFISGAL